MHRRAQTLSFEVFGFEDSLLGWRPSNRRKALYVELPEDANVSLFVVGFSFDRWYIFRGRMV